MDNTIYQVVSGRFSHYNGIWLHTKQARALNDLTAILDTEIPDITNNSLGSFGFMHENHSVVDLRLFRSYFNQSAQLDVLPESIGDLEELRTLDVSHNLLRYLPSRITELEELENFYLDYNNFRKFPRELRHLKLLRQLNFDENQLTSISKEIGEISYLQSLHIAGNRLSEFPTNLASLEYLRRLDLTRNWISKLDYTILDLFPQLYVLDLRGNRIPPKQVSKAIAFLRLSGKQRRKYYLEGSPSDYEDPFSLRNLEKRIRSDPFIDTPEDEEDLTSMARVLQMAHYHKYQWPDTIRSS